MSYLGFMYIAYQKHRGQARFSIRESCTIDQKLTYRDLFDLGPDPSVFIIYAGGNAFYFDEAMEDALSESGAAYDSDELETLFWPWIRPDIKRAVDTFRNRSFNRSSNPLTDLEKEQIAGRVHHFDKRRAHYLKFGTMDQGPVENMPATLFKDHVNQSRDEIEQYFLKQEFALKAHELKSYVFTIFDLHRFFSSFMARKMPHALDQEKVDTFFIKEICDLNQTLFHRKTRLDDYLVRYVIMFFDHAYADTTLLDDFAKSFMFRHRVFTPPAKKHLPTQEACAVFHITRQALSQMTKRRLTRLYRKLARQVHPDTGGSHEKFVELNNAYETLLEKINTPP